MIHGKYHHFTTGFLRHKRPHSRLPRILDREGNMDEEFECEDDDEADQFGEFSKEESYQYENFFLNRSS